MILRNPRGWIGVDLGTKSLKFAQVEKSGRRLRLKAAAIVERKNEIDPSLWLRTIPSSSAFELKQAIKTSKFSGNQVACVSPIAICDIRPLQVSDDSPSEIQRSIGQQLAEIHSIPAENLHFDYWIDQNEQTQVLCMADRWTETILKDHKENRLACHVLDGLPHSLVRAAALAENHDPSKPVAIFDWGASTATFCVAFDSRPVYVRCLPDFGFNLFLQKIANALDLEESDVLQATTQHGMPDGGTRQGSEIQQIIAEILEPATVEMISEILRTLTFIRSQKFKISVDRGLLFGAGATVKNIDVWLGTKLGISIKNWRLDENKLGASGYSNRCPIELLGPAVASSCLAWGTP